MIDAVVLAAGESSRMGLPKLLLPAGPGDVVLTLLMQSVLDSSIRRVHVVTGRDAPSVNHVLETRFPEARSAGRLRIVHNSHYRQGLAGSIRVGLQALNRPLGVCLIVADQPLIRSRQLNRLIESFRNRPPGIRAVVASKEGDPRNPALFSRGWVDRLRSLEGDRGAKPLLLEHPEAVQTIDWDDGSWLRDIDTWADYRREAHSRNWSSETPGDWSPVEQPHPQPPVPDLLERALRLEPIPWIRPGTLLVPLGLHDMPDASEAVGASRTVVYRFGSPFRPRENGEQAIREAVVGDAGCPERYLRLIRTAVLRSLQEQAD